MKKIKFDRIFEFHKICKLSFMKRGTKVLCDKRSRFSDHFAHPTHPEQAGLGN